ncbi:unnamed protein product [Cuscuta europaea]|uniref:Uncharacterized protein n=1 Tax=Cuscuta europaea TaxID=41803 RepID=A0A9P0YQC5_CUSEU|nr:unnamed protein product [Cuscuta europaea]
MEFQQVEVNEETPEQQPTTSTVLKEKILTDGAEDTPTLAEVFIQERRATTKFINNAEVRLHKRLIKMQKHFDKLLEMRFAEVHRYIKSNLMIQQVFNSEQKAQLNIQLSQQPAQLEAIHKDLADQQEKDRELENQIQAYIRQLRDHELAVGSQPTAESSAQVPSLPSLPPNLEQALQRIQEHEAYINKLKNEEFPTMPKLSQKFLI